GTNWNLYRNGVQIGQNAAAFGAVAVPASWAIANGTSGGNGRLYNGPISHAAIYNYALTPGRILGHYFQGTVGTTNPSPVITAQPASATRYEGADISFTVAAMSATPMTYQWKKGGTPLGGKTNSTLALVNLQSADAGNYS